MPPFFMSSLPTLERLNEVFTHSIVEGRLYWNDTRRRRNIIAGENQTVRKRVRVDGKHYSVSRIIWKMVTGTDPEELEVDHEDRDHTNDAFHNLRLASRVENGRNRRFNKSKGLRGTVWHKVNKKWMARIVLEGKLTYLGSFDTREEAHQCYVEAHKKHFGAYSVY